MSSDDDLPNDFSEPQKKQDNSEAYSTGSAEDFIPLSNLRNEAPTPDLESSDDDIPLINLKKEAPSSILESSDDNPLSNLRKEAPSKVLGSPEVDTQSTIISLNRLNKILSGRFRTVRTIDDLGRVQTFNIVFFR